MGVRRQAEGVLCQPSDEGLRAPFAERGWAVEPLPDRGTSAEPREVRLDRRLVDEHQPVRVLAHAWLMARDPIVTGLAERGPVTLGCDQSFFYMTVQPVREHGAARRAEQLNHVFRQVRRPVP